MHRCDVKCVSCDAVVLTLPLDSETEAAADIITRRDNPFLNSTPHHKEEEDKEEEGEEGKVMPNKQKDDLAQRRAQTRPVPHRGGPRSIVSAAMSQADMQKWERLKMTEPRCPEHTLCSTKHLNAAVCQVCDLLTTVWMRVWL